MGSIAVSVSALTRTLAADDAAMTDVLLEVIEATGGPVGGTNTQKMDWILTIWRRYLMEIANGNRRAKAAAVAQANAAVITL